MNEVDIVVNVHWDKHVSLLVVSLLLHPATGIATQDVTTNFIVDEDDYGERERHQPPVQS